MSIEVRKPIRDIIRAFSDQGYTARGLFVRPGPEPSAVLEYEKGWHQVEISTYPHGATSYAITTNSDLTNPHRDDPEEFNRALQILRSS